MAAVRRPEYIGQEQDQIGCNNALHHIKEACGLSLHGYLNRLRDDPKSVAEKLRVYKARMVQREMHYGEQA